MSAFSVDVRWQGVIVATASVAGTVPTPDAPVYAASKAGVVSFVRSLAPSLKEQRGIRINAVAPHFTHTNMVIDQMGEDGRLGKEVVMEMVGGKELLRAQDIADAVLELVNDENQNGAILRVLIGKGKEYWPRRRQARAKL